MFVLSVRKSLTSGNDVKPGGGPVWTVVTQRNSGSYPYYRVDDFASQSEAVAYLKRVEPRTPRVSLGGKASDPLPSWEEYQAWLKNSNLRPSYLEPDDPSDHFIFRLYRKGLDDESAPTYSRPSKVITRGSDSYLITSEYADYKLDEWIYPQLAPFWLFTGLKRRFDQGIQPWPWAVVCFGTRHKAPEGLHRDYSDGLKVIGFNHRCSYASTSYREDVDVFQPCTAEQPDPVDEFTILFVFEKEGLRDLTERSAEPKLGYAWNELKDASEEGMWLALIGPF